MSRAPGLVGLIVALAVNSTVFAQQGPQPTQREIKTHILQPAKLPADEAHLKLLKLPDGFEIKPFARDLIMPRIIFVATDGCVYVTSREAGTCLLLKDTDNDGVADVKTVVAQRPNLHGLTLSPDQTKAYFVTVNELYEVPRNPDGTFGEPKKLLSDLPDGGQHPTPVAANSTSARDTRRATVIPASLPASPQGLA